MSDEIEYGPEPPDELPDDAVRYWRMFAPWLAKSGTLEEQDHQALVMLCVTLATWADAVETLRREGYVVMGQRGRMRNPAASAVTQSFDAALKLMGQLGLTPLARKRLAVVYEDGPSLFDLLNADDGIEDAA
jgi:P27 family predicted phage terminase small subunit